MKIYDHKGLPNPARVRIALAEKGLTDQVTFVHVDVFAGGPREPAFLAKNPSGGVPVLELDDGTLISECAAITDYLDLSAGEADLTGRTPKERAVIHMTQRRVEAGLLDAVADYFHHATPGLGPVLETDQLPAWGERRRQRAERTMRMLDQDLATRPFLAGETFSVADITAFAGLLFAGFAKIGVPAECGRLRDWQARVAARPSVAMAA